VLKIPLEFGAKVQTLFRTKDEALIGNVLGLRVRIVDAEEGDGFVVGAVVDNLP
jgi:hypothetical protein